MTENISYRPSAYPSLDGADARYFTGEFRKIAQSIGAMTDVWSEYTPTITASVGTFTTVLGSGRYKQIGRNLFMVLTVDITTNGTAAGIIIATLPKPAIQGLLANGVDTNTGWALTAGGAPGTTVGIVKYDGTYPGGNGAQLAISGFYEVAG